MQKIVSQLSLTSQQNIKYSAKMAIVLASQLIPQIRLEDNSPAILAFSLSLSLSRALSHIMIHCNTMRRRERSLPRIRDLSLVHSSLHCIFQRSRGGHHLSVFQGLLFREQGWQREDVASPYLAPACGPATRPSITSLGPCGVTLTNHMVIGYQQGYQLPTTRQYFFIIFIGLVFLHFSSHFPFHQCSLCK